MKAKVFLNTITIRVNTHDLIGVPTDKSEKEFFEAMWNHKFENWKLESSERVHYEVFDFCFESEFDTLASIKELKHDVSEIVEKYLQKK